VALELLTATLFVTAVLVHGPTWIAARVCAMAAFLVALSAIDLELWILPFELTLPGIGVGLASSLLLGRAALLECVVGAAVAFAGFWALERLLLLVLRREGLGAGDKYLFALIGGFLGWPALFPVLLLSNLQGAVVGIGLLVVRGRAGPPPPEPPPPEEDDGWRPGVTHLPFGPWLALAALEVALLVPLVREYLPRSLLPLLGAEGPVLP
jgi:leader peptidase (prepilin peptidase)/N-methyltransferase